MKKIFLGFSFFCIILSCSANSFEQFPLEVGGIKIGQSTLEDVRTLYGVAKEVPLNINDESDARLAICYSSSHTQKDSYLIIEANSMHALKNVGSIRIASVRPDIECSETNILIDNVVTSNGLHLWMSLDDFCKKMGEGCTIKDNTETIKLRFTEILYIGNQEKKLNSFCSNCSAKAEDRWSLVSDIWATFENNVLVDLYIAQILVN